MSMMVSLDLAAGWTIRPNVIGGRWERADRTARRPDVAAMLAKPRRSLRSVKFAASMGRPAAVHPVYLAHDALRGKDFRAPHRNPLEFGSSPAGAARPGECPVWSVGLPVSFSSRRRTHAALVARVSEDASQDSELKKKVSFGR
jgi:hypothetical protein